MSANVEAEHGPFRIPVMRRDAQARRDALLDAAMICFRQSGYGVALEDVAAAAGVGRGTLYRNFKDRMALVLAVFERELRRIGERLDPAGSLDDTIATMALDGAPTTALFNRLALDLPLDPDSRRQFEMLAERMATMLRPIVERAHDEGRLDRSIGTRQVVLVIRMISNLLLKHQSREEKQAVLVEVLALFRHGLLPRSVA